MTSSPPQEAPHFRGKTLTPESPVPVHVPEPQHIPVLMNQTDLAFNDMSTHMEERYPSQLGTVAEAQGIPYPCSGLNAQTTTPTRTDLNQASQHIPGADECSNTEGGNEIALASEGENTERKQEIIDSKNLLNTQSSLSNGAHDSISSFAQVTPLSSTPSQTNNPPTNITQGNTVSSDQCQILPVRQDPDADALRPPQDCDAHSQASSSDVNGEGVNYQALLDNLSPPTPTPTTSEPPATNNAPTSTSSPGSVPPPIATLPVPAGLPPRPPPQDKPAIHPNYTPGEDIRSYHNPPAQNSSVTTIYNSQPNNGQRPPQSFTQANTVAPNGLPPPPIPTFQQPLSTGVQTDDTPQEMPKDMYGRNNGRQQAPSEGEDEHPRRPEVEKLYEQFLCDEAIYVAEGTWDRFPQGSRLFIGNLFTEKVTKRDIFYVFHKYGRLAQISMKSAYGFVQYHDANACMRALQTEQGIELRGRKTHLEISKPQKNSRNAVTTTAGDNLRAGYSRRSRSPDYTRGGSGWQGGQRPGGDRYDRNSMSSTFERRGRDDYRPGMRSPSPRGYRIREDGRGGARGRSPDHYYRGRPRSPFDRNGHYRTRSPIGPDPDDEASLPIMRRNPRDVPDVQLILVDEVDRTFVGYIQQSFRDRGLRCDVLQLPRVSLAAIVKRQVVEGVQAVVKIFRRSQNTGKIPLQVYNRSSGAENVQFDEYEDLDANVAAELVVRAKTTHIAPAPAPQQYHPSPVYGASHYSQPQQQMQQHQSQQPQQPQADGAPPNLANLITSLDGPALQKLLGAMSQTPQTPSNPHQSSLPSQPGQQQDLSSLLQSVVRQQPPSQTAQQGFAYGNVPQQQQNAYGTPAANHAYGNTSVFAQQAGPSPQSYHTQQQQQLGQQHNVQEMLAQLARYKQ